MSKHTPGPWIASPDPYGIVDDWMVGVQGGKADQVAVCSRCDASLIAAAPDLLEALLMVRDADDDAIMDCISRMPELARAKVDAAIAKATGND